MYQGETERDKLERRCWVCGRLSITPVSMNDRFAKISGLADFRITFPHHTGFPPMNYKLCHKCSKTLLTYINHMQQVEMQRRESIKREFLK